MDDSITPILRMAMECGELKERLRAERDERSREKKALQDRILTLDTENEQLVKECKVAEEKLARYEERAARRDVVESDE